MRRKRRKYLGWQYGVNVAEKSGENMRSAVKNMKMPMKEYGLLEKARKGVAIKCHVNEMAGEIFACSAYISGEEHEK
jgi:hypothetical protein